MTRKVIVYIAASLDGYIAAPGDDLSFLQIVEQEGEDYGYMDFTSTVDTVIMGRRTYDWVMKQVPEFPHSDKTAYIITHESKPPVGSTHFYTGDLNTLVEQLKSAEGKNIFVDGGAEIINQMLALKLVDEIIVSFIPILLGDGVRLFKTGIPQQQLTLVTSKSFPKGLVQVHYSVNK